MRAEELRIGNLVTTPMGVFKIRGLDLNESDFKASCFNPIPLTEEWLVKFDGVKDDEGVVYLLLPRKADVRLYIEGGHILECKGATYPLSEFRHIKHVHQLQNLYFALTGEELTIKK